MAGIEEGNFQRINNSSDRINNSACKKPSEACSRKGVKDWNKSQYAQPSHSDIEDGGDPFGAVDPAALQNNSGDCNDPYQGTQDIADFIMQGNEAYRGVASGNHDKDHHVIHLSETPVDFLCGVYGMVYGACSIKQNHD